MKFNNPQFATDEDVRRHIHLAAGVPPMHGDIMPIKFRDSPDRLCTHPKLSGAQPSTRRCPIPNRPSRSSAIPCSVSADTGIRA